MKRGGGKEKGSAYERLIAATLSLAYYPDGGGVFQRIYAYPMSKKGEVRSDLVALKYIADGPDGKSLVLDRSFPFAVECKNYRAVKPLFCGLYAKPCEVWDWLEQSSTASEGKMPVVVFRLYRTKDILMINDNTFGRLKETFGSYPCEFFSVTQCTPQSDARKTLNFFVLEGFLKWIDWGVFRLSEHARYIRSLVPKED